MTFLENRYPSSIVDLTANTAAKKTYRAVKTVFGPSKKTKLSHAESANIQNPYSGLSPTPSVSQPSFTTSPCGFVDM